MIWPWMDVIGLRPQIVLALGGVGGLALGLAARNLVGNLIAGSWGKDFPTHRTTQQTKVQAYHGSFDSLLLGGSLIQLNRPFVEGLRVARCVVFSLSALVLSALTGRDLLK